MTLFTVPGFLSANECAALIHESEERGFGAAPIDTGKGFRIVPEIRNNTRVMVDDFAHAERLWARLRQAKQLDALGLWQPVGLNERFRFYRYDEGQVFRWHRDGAFIRSIDEQSLLTFMIYLNQDFAGGATQFEHIEIIPRTGDALVFDHGLRHQGAEVTRGTKYVLRSDVMFRRLAGEASQ